jgi:hypothetical protein
MENQPMQNVSQRKNVISIGGLLNSSVEIYRKKAKTFAVILSINVPLLLIGLLISYSFNPKNPPSNPLVVLGLMVFFVVYLIVTAWSVLSVVFAIKERESTITVKQILILGWLSIPSYIWIYFLMGLAILAGFILLIIPGIIFAVWFSFAIYLFVSEGVKGKAALTASKKLVQGYWWAVFGRIVAMIFIMFMVSLIIGWVPLLGQLVNLFVMLPFFVIYMYLLHEDLKKVKI